MFLKQAIIEHSDSLIDILSAECADLEKLLALAHAEFAAVNSGDFEEIYEIISERETICEKLETYGRQVAELRGNLGLARDVIFQDELDARLVGLVTEIMRQDAKTRPLLEAAKEESVRELNRVDNMNRRANAYSHDTMKGVAYSKNL